MPSRYEAFFAANRFAVMRAQARSVGAGAALPAACLMARGGSRTMPPGQCRLNSRSFSRCQSRSLASARLS